MIKDPIDLLNSNEFKKAWTEFKKFYSLEPTKYTQAYRLVYLTLNRLVSKGIVDKEDRRYLAENIAKEMARKNGWE